MLCRKIHVDLSPEDEDSMFLSNDGIYLQVYLPMYLSRYLPTRPHGVTTHNSNISNAELNE
jgi:hypothetical protein